MWTDGAKAGRTIRALIVSPHAGDKEALAAALVGGGCEQVFEQISSGKGLQELISKNVWDVAFIDCAMFQDAIIPLKKGGRDMPAIVICDDSNEDFAVRAMQGGARDYVLRDNLRRVVPIVDRELKDRAERIALNDAERRTHRLRREIEFVLGATKTGLDIIDSDFNTVYVDSEWAKIYGDYAGRKCYEYFADRNTPCPSCGIPKAFETKKSVVAEEVLPKEGNRPILVITTPFQDEDGKWLFAETNVDIAERKMAEQKIIQAAKLAGIGDMAAGVAHEIYNPLTAILGYVQLLMENKKAAPQMKEDLKKVEAQTRRCIIIIDSLLHFARPHLPMKEEVDVNIVLDATMKILEYSVEREKIQIVKKYGSALPRFTGDFLHLQQAFMNIIINSVNAMGPDGGTLTIATECRKSEKELVVSISDTGIGIPEDAIDNIFTPFFSTPYKMGKKGAGLGLTISRTIVEEHGGRIEVESQVGRGSTFHIMLPIF